MQITGLYAVVMLVKVLRKWQVFMLLLCLWKCCANERFSCCCYVCEGVEQMAGFHAVVMFVKVLRKWHIFMLQLSFSRHCSNDRFSCCCYVCEGDAQMTGFDTAVMFVKVLRKNNTEKRKSPSLFKDEFHTKTIIPRLWIIKTKNKLVSTSDKISNYFT